MILNIMNDNKSKTKWTLKLLNKIIMQFYSHTIMREISSVSSANV